MLYLCSPVNLARITLAIGQYVLFLISLFQPVARPRRSAPVAQHALAANPMCRLQSTGTAMAACPVPDHRCSIVPPAWPRSRDPASVPARWSHWTNSLKVSCPQSLNRPRQLPPWGQVFLSVPARQVPLLLKPVAGDLVPLKSPTMLRVKIKILYNRFSLCKKRR